MLFNLGQVAVDQGDFGSAEAFLAESTDIARSRDAGFVEHLTKPVTFDALERALSRVVQGGGSRGTQTEDY